MKYNQWREEIVNKLVEVGFDRAYSQEKALGVKGLYYNTNKYMDTDDAVRTIMKTAHVHFLESNQIVRYERKYRDNLNVDLDRCGVSV